MQKDVEMITFDTNIVPNSERRFNYAYNVPSERITFVKSGLIQRKNESSMSDTEKRAFINGITGFNNLAASQYVGGNYRQTVTIHEKPHRMHSLDGPVGTQRFLTWHRYYLAALESWVRASVEPNFFIPYWDWTTNPNVPSWLQNFLPTVYVPDTESIPPTPSYYDKVVVYRTPGQQQYGFLPTSQQVQELFTYETYTDFTLHLEWLHNGVHTWVGGPMINIRISPADPLFWLHHANIDRIWTQWQTTHSNQNPNLSAIDQELDPWYSHNQYATEPEWRTNRTCEYV
jgi:tyrosinase